MVDDSLTGEVVQAVDASTDEPSPVCSTCGVMPSGDHASSRARITWSKGLELGRVVWTCDRCTRTHARAIEGKLDSAWW